MEQVVADDLSVYINIKVTQSDAASEITKEVVEKMYNEADYILERDGTNNVGDSWAYRETLRMKKLLDLLSTGVYCQWYKPGLVLVEEKYVVSLSSKKWRVKGKNTWYWHKQDLNHFVDNYVKRTGQKYES